MTATRWPTRQERTVTTSVILEGTLRPDGLVELDSKPSLLPGRVQVVLQPLPADNGSRAAAAYPPADFFEPVGFAWTEAGYEVRQALKEYSEGTHADHSGPAR